MSAGKQAASSSPVPDLDRPFRSAPLSLRQLAAVHGEIDVDSSRQAAVLAKYGITTHTKNALDEELRTACARHPEAAQAWEQACATYRAWKQQAKR